MRKLAHINSEGLFMVQRYRRVSMSWRFSYLAVLICLVGFAGTAMAQIGNHTIVYSEDFETGFGAWAPTAGEWEVGMPTTGPGEAYAGSGCAATSLGGNYAYAIYSRLQSPWVTLPANPTDGALWLRIWHYFNLSASDGSDLGQVQIYTEADGWVGLGSFYRYSVNWAPWMADISAYAGMDVKIGLLIDDVDGGGYGSSQGPGWYVDELSIFDGAFPALGNPEGFENRFTMDWDGWYTTRGVWQIGKPTFGCTEAKGWGGNCAGTVLDAAYPYAANSSLVSPLVTLPASPRDGVLHLAFQQWCQLHYSDGIDYGRVEIWDGIDWITLRDISYYEAHWSECVLDISTYAGMTVRFGFRMIDVDGGGYGSAQGPGWFIDDVTLIQGRRYTDNPASCENYCPDWVTSSGVWQIGTPSYGTSTTPSGENCWGTNLDGPYSYRSYDELRTPWMDLPVTPSEPLSLNFQHYFSFSTSDGSDSGTVRIHTDDGTITELGTVTGNSGGSWSPYPLIDLSAFAGQRVSFGFVVSDVDGGGYGHSEGAGWYIDDIEITGMPQSVPADPIGLTMGITAGPASLSWYHNPDGIQNVIVYGSPNEDFLPTYGTRFAIIDPATTSFDDPEHEGWPNLFYRISIVDANGHQSLPVYPMFMSDVPDPSFTDERLMLRGIYPNPFNPLTTVKFSTPRAGKAEVLVYDVSGRMVRLLASEVFAAGDHELQWDGRNNDGGRVSSGIYFCVVKSDNGWDSAKMTLVK